MRGFLKVQRTKIITQKGKPITLQGVNLGGWLMMEGYILHSLNNPEQSFKKDFTKALGKSALYHFEKSFRDYFIQEKDVEHIASVGLNCIRVPFNYRLIEKTPYKYDKQGVHYLDQVVNWAQKNKIWVILDLHAACGAQNHDWHSDSLGAAALWKNNEYQKRTYALWEFLADRYKDKESIAGYDLLNESVLENTKILNKFYKQLIRTIRSVDKKHILFVEGNRWSVDLDCLDKFEDDNLVLSIHAYEPLDFTFNFVPHSSYPIKSSEGIWDKHSMKKLLSKYKKVSEERSVPIFVGEFGVNYRQGVYGEHKWLRDILSCFKDFGFHWTYWTYKAIKNNIFPDGLFSYMANSPWVNRQGPRLGWDTYKTLWGKKKKDMIHSWYTDSFHENKILLRVLKDAIKKNN